MHVCMCVCEMERERTAHSPTSSAGRDLEGTFCLTITQSRAWGKRGSPWPCSELKPDSLQAPLCSQSCFLLPRRTPVSCCPADLQSMSWVPPPQPPSSLLQAAQPQSVFPCLFCGSPLPLGEKLVDLCLVLNSRCRTVYRSLDASALGRVEPSILPARTAH